ncbi:MAG: hypothetical protein WC932_06305 [archaeon]|jgi:hypothetical protein
MNNYIAFILGMWLMGLIFYVLVKYHTNKILKKMKEVGKTR